VATTRRSVIVSILFTVFGGPGIVLVYLPYWITRFRIPAAEPPLETLLAAGLIFLGLLPLLDSIRRFVTDGRGTLMPNVPTERLVVSGLYCYVRNPMYVGCMLALAGEIVLFHSPDLAVYAALAWLGVHGFVRLYEEPTLTHRYPLDYPLYRQNVPRWWPRFTPWNPGRAPHL
jgi:protein-S-isoprenylcysteine O-methyltransferase Ste14